MFEIECPACGAAGRAPKQKIQTRLVCKKCLKVFYVTPSGKTVLGEPPATGQTATGVSPGRAQPDRTQKVDQWFDRASKRLFSPTSLILTVGLMLAVAAVYFSVWRPESLEYRVAQAARAAVQGIHEPSRNWRPPEAATLSTRGTSRSGPSATSCCSDWAQIS